MTTAATRPSSRPTTGHPQVADGDIPEDRGPALKGNIMTTNVTTTAPVRAAAEDAANHGPIARIVAASVVSGFVSALLATLVLFAGAREHVITGSALLAFGFGWAMLAVLSTRMTSQPQRWALVPAAVMTVVGAGLFLLAPANSALTAAGWVWPPILFVLAVWCSAQARRSLRSRSRIWLIYPVLAVLALGAVGGAYQSIAVAADHHTDAAPGRAVDVGGRTLQLNCQGTGSPTVILESGLGENATSWALISRSIARSTRVCAYDRAGQGWSQDARAPQDARAVAADLHTLLRTAPESGPYVLVGHSTGGAYALTYAAQYPQDVAGLVLLDSASAHQFDLPDYPAVYAMMRRGLALLPSLSRLGIGQLALASTGESLPEPAAAQARAFATGSRDLRSQRDEISTYRQVFAQAQALTSLGSKPLVVLTATAGSSQRGWADAQNQLARLSTNVEHRSVAATHASLLESPADARYSVAAITTAVQAVRTGEMLPAS
jgi:pimeloyl-ACP methyl ester carboxylesterase